MTVIDIGKDFSPYPAGRYYDDGPYNGQKFREEVLIPSLVKSKHIIIELDNTRGYDSSFLEEAFGGIFRDMDIELSSILSRIELKTEDLFLEQEIISYMKDAYSERNKH